MSEKPNPFNPQGIRAGDTVRLLSSGKQYRVDHVGGQHSNKVYCKPLGHEYFANCFDLVHRDTAKPNWNSEKLS